MAPFGQRPAKKPEREPSMTYDGTNGAKITDWSRDGDLSTRFQDRSQEIPGEVARIRLPMEDGRGDHWVVVPVGATIHQTLGEDRALALELPEDPEPAEAGETDADA